MSETKDRTTSPWVAGFEAARRELGTTKGVEGEVQFYPEYRELHVRRGIDLFPLNTETPLPDTKAAYYWMLGRMSK